MLLYYGSDKELVKPLYNFGNPTNDYGLGLYLTESYEMAKLWATKYENGYVIKYDFDYFKLKVLRLDTNSNEDVLRWITILINHRFDYREKILYKERVDFLNKYYSIDIEAYDVIIGYRADDSYFSYSKSFLANELSIEKLKEAMILGRLRKQIVLKSQKAFDLIKFVSSEKVQKSEQYENFRVGVLNEYHKIKNEDSDINTFIRDIIRSKN